MSVLTGALILGLGMLFWTTNGLVGAPALLPIETQAWLQERSALLANPVVDILAVLAIVMIALTVWLVSRRRPRAQDTAANQDDRVDEAT